jgi:hypothetical protein
MSCRLWWHRLFACLAGASVTHKRTLETRETSCVPRASMHFFIPVVNSPGAVGNVATPEPPPGGKAQSHVTRGSVRAHRHVAAPELLSVRRRGPGLQDMWQCWSLPRSGGEVRGRGTRGNAGAHLSREAGSGAIGYMTACGCMSCSMSWLEACIRGYPICRVTTIHKFVG